MTLLSAITAAAEAGAPSPAPKHPLILNGDAAVHSLVPGSDSPANAALVKRVSGWSLSSTDTDIAVLVSSLSKTLTRKLKNPRSLNRDECVGLLGSFFQKCAERIGLAISVDPSDPNFIPKAIEKLGFVIGREAAGLILEGCLILEVWEVIETLILQKLAGNLKLFFAIEKATHRGLDEKVTALAREASILLAMAHDRFSSSEVCLHYVFGSSNLDDLVLSSAILRLDGSEVLTLVRYFIKWLEKYQRFPEAGPCPSAMPVLGLTVCDSIPSLESVARGLGLVLDEHFSYLVLSSEFHEEMRAIERLVKSFASEAELCLPVNEIIKHLQLEARQY
ncbi:uncharacterized protein LOC120255366 [Dioscorea cayenensis subsp. rotundata]|uniref:Uncharacterized protein LOC120255366 n=1 Tax=Dioscorea cayennensis subsp. rotundata TaxID=55577 RepID=A0AB40AVV3_DIOCR|nr:uncharacterized protein LOC120255366 [Dioscorea cayenensis subsp. rotundata]